MAAISGGKAKLAGELAELVDLAGEDVAPGEDRRRAGCWAVRGHVVVLRGCG